MVKIKGKIVSGYGVASGKGRDPRYPEGTLRLQVPFFKKGGLDLEQYFLGTLNIDISPFLYEIKKPTYFFESIAWSEHIPPENFYFFNVALIFDGKSYNGFIYMPGPETKFDHEQLPTMLEVIMPRIENIKTGHKVDLQITEESLKIYKGV